MDSAFGVVSRKSLLNSQPSTFYPMLPSRSFIVLHFIFRTMIYFMFFFSFKNVRFVSRLFFFYVDIQLFPHHLLKRSSLLHCIVRILFPKDTYLCVISFLNSVLFLWSMCVFLPFPPLFGYCSFIANLEVM